MSGGHGLIGPFPKGTDHEEYDRRRRRALWRLPMGLYVLGSRHEGRLNLMTLNWAMQVAVEPKQVAVSIEGASLTHTLVAGGQAFALALVAREDRALVRRFVKPCEHDPEAKTLAGIAYLLTSTGCPVPCGAVGYIDCEVRHSVDLGSHTVFVGEVVDVAPEAGAREPGTGEPEPGASPGAEAEAEVAVLRMEDTRMSYGG